VKTKQVVGQMCFVVLFFFVFNVNIIYITYTYGLLSILISASLLPCNHTALSMDMQSSTAPLLRQLESMERQSRLRTANAAELESRLRSELEEATIENETLGKDCSEFKSKLTRLERYIKERDEEVAVAQKTIEEQTITITGIKQQEEKLKLEADKRQIEYEKVERLANEGVSRVRSEMTQTVIDSEERYRGQIDKMEKELKIELEKRNQLEDQVGQLLENTGGMFASSQTPQSSGIRRESKPKKLHRAEGQAEILAGALGLGEESDDNDTDDDDDDDDDDDHDGDDHVNPSNRGSLSSFAALEQLSSKLRSSEADLKSMRRSLKESNESRQSMVEELGEGRHAKEKLPLFEFKVKELSKENREMEREIAGLKDDIADVRELYRTQLNVLLEEKTASMSSITTETPPPANNADNNQDDQNDGGDNDR
jgi:chromosome segregation ATPase